MKSMNPLMQQIVVPILLASIYWASDRYTKEYCGVEYHKAISYLILIVLSILIVIFINPYQTLINENRFLNVFIVVVLGLIVGEILSPVFDNVFSQ